MKRIGRPTIEAADGRKASLGLKVTPSIKAKLDAAAKLNGRTQSQEAEYRLHRSFDEDDLVSRILTALHGVQK